jgi:hypothetical protein
VLAGPCAYTAPLATKTRGQALEAVSTMRSAKEALLSAFINYYECLGMKGRLLDSSA